MSTASTSTPPMIHFSAPVMSRGLHREVKGLLELRSRRGDELFDAFERGGHRLAGAAARGANERLDGFLRYVPALAHERAAVSRRELVAPDAPATEVGEDPGRPGLPRDHAIGLEL